MQPRRVRPEFRLELKSNLNWRGIRSFPGREWDLDSHTPGPAGVSPGLCRPIHRSDRVDYKTSLTDKHPRVLPGGQYSAGLGGTDAAVPSRNSHTCFISRSTMDWDRLSSYAGLLGLAASIIYSGSYGSLPVRQISNFDVMEATPPN